MPFVEGLRETRTEEGTPYSVGVHVDWGVVGGREEIAPCKRWRQYMSSRKPADSLAHDRLWSLITNTQPTNSRNIFEGALFHLHNTSEPRRKRAPPFFSPVYFYLLSRTCDANFTPYTYCVLFT